MELYKTMNEIAPHFGIKHGNLDSDEFKEFLRSYSMNLFKYGKPNIIDVEVLSPSFARELVNDDESIVIYMGYPSITPEEKLQQIRKYDTEFDWTRGLEDEELLEFISANIETSKRLQEEAKEEGFIFIDTSYNREETIAKTFDELCERGQLDRTEESYARYAR